MKNWIDAVFILLSVLAIIQGYRAGFIATIFSVIGYIGGGLAGLTLGLHYFHAHGVTKFIYLFLAVTIASSIGEVLLKSVGKLFHSKILFAPFTWVDSLLGAAFSLLKALVGLLILAHLLLITPWGWASANIPKSEIYQKLNKVAPALISDITKRAQAQLH
jgi:uncharacterized membrane protein required for colicin V production